MGNVVDLGERRFDAAKDSSETAATDALRTALARIERGEWPVASVMVVGLEQSDDGDVLQVINGGPATTLERIGMLFRAQVMINENSFTD